MHLRDPEIEGAMRWVDVPNRKNCLVMNIGRLLAKLTDGLSGTEHIATKKKKSVMFSIRAKTALLLMRVEQLVFSLLLLILPT